MQHEHVPRSTGAASWPCALAIAATAAVATPAHAAQTKTLRFFDKGNTSASRPRTGRRRTSPPARPAAGDILDASGTLYRGNHRHHGSRVVGTDHTRCVFTGPDSGTCQGEVALGNSLILVQQRPHRRLVHHLVGHRPVQAASRATGQSKRSANGNNSDVVVRYRIG